MSDKSIVQEQKNSFSNVNLFWGFSPRSPHFVLSRPSLKRQPASFSNGNKSVLSESMSLRDSEDNSNDLSRLSVDISSILQNCVSQSENRTSTSSISHKECVRESRSYVNRNMQQVQIYLKGQGLKKNFLDIVRICLVDKFFNAQISEQWNCENLFKSFSLVRLDHPFIEVSSVKSDSIETFFLDWIRYYDVNKRLIVSFDFLLSHLTLILILIFYWFHTYEVKTNPLCSSQQSDLIYSKIESTRHSILMILMDYANLRSRDVKCNIIAAKLLNQFYKYIQNTLMHKDPLIQQSHQLLQHRFQYESFLMENLSSSLQFSCQILKQMEINYSDKDKMIKDSLVDLVDVFNLVDMKAFINTPLSAYYDTQQIKESKYQAASRHTYLSCWLFKLLIEASRKGGYLGIQYIHRYQEMTEALLKSKNCESGLLFISTLMTIKDCLPSLWAKYKQKFTLSEQTFVSLLETAQNFSFNSLIPHKVKIFQRIELAKEKFKGKYLSFRFHQTIYEIARIVQRCKQNIQKQFKSLESKKSKIKVNYNQSFIHHHVYEVMKSQNPNANELYESLKQSARQLDKQIKFPLFGFSIF